MPKVRHLAKRHSEASACYILGAREVVFECSVEDFMRWMRGEHLVAAEDPRKLARRVRRAKKVAQ